MDYFSKRYNAQLSKLDQLESEILDTPTLKKQSSSTRADGANKKQVATEETKSVPQKAVEKSVANELDKKT